MYKRCIMLDKDASLSNGSLIKPIATLADEYGGRAQIAIDDHCYILYIGSKERSYSASSHWFKEAVEVLQTLPLPN